MTQPTQTTPSTTATGAATTAATRSTAVDKDMFLKLLVAQVSHQDPMKPTDSSEWLAQMAQFSTVEQLANLAKTSSQASHDAQVNAAVGLLGRSVSYHDGNATAQGTVEKVDLSGANGPTLTISGHAGIAASALVDVR